MAGMKLFVFMVTVCLHGKLAYSQLQNTPIQCGDIDELIQMPDNCNFFVHCLSRKPIIKKCPDNQVFSDVAKGCVLKDDPKNDCSVPGPAGGSGSPAISSQSLLCRLPDELLQIPTECNFFIECVAGQPLIKKCSEADSVFSDVLKICVPKDTPLDDCTSKAIPQPGSTVTAIPQPGGIGMPTGGGGSVSLPGTFKDIQCRFPDEYIQVPTDCSYFVHCGNGGQPIIKRCPVDLVFSYLTKTCVFKNSLYDDCPSGAPSPTRPPRRTPPPTRPPRRTLPQTRPPIGGSGIGASGTGGSGIGAGGSVNLPGAFQDIQCRFPDEYIQVPTDCNYFVHCGNGGQPFIKRCPVDLVFSYLTKTCVFKNSLYDDCSSGTPPPTRPPRRTPPPTRPSRRTPPPTRVTTRRPVNSRQGEVAHLTGNLSGRGNNAVSSVNCPSGSIVLNCVCRTLGNCQGTSISGRRCQAYNSPGGAGQQALGVCYYDAADQWVLTRSGPTPERNPSAPCPNDFKVMACTLYYGNSNTQDIRPLLDVNTNSCRSTNACLFGRGCRTQAICQRR